MSTKFYSIQKFRIKDSRNRTGSFQKTSHSQQGSRLEKDLNQYIGNKTSYSKWKHIKKKYSIPTGQQISSSASCQLMLKMKCKQRIKTEERQLRFTEYKKKQNIKTLNLSLNESNFFPLTKSNLRYIEKKQKYKFKRQLPRKSRNWFFQEDVIKKKELNLSNCNQHPLIDLYNRTTVETLQSIKKNIVLKVPFEQIANVDDYFY